MTQSVKRYLEIGKTLTAQYAASHPIEYKALRDERADLTERMTVSELKSLENYVTRREFVMYISPIITAKQETVAVASSTITHIGTVNTQGNVKNGRVRKPAVAAASRTAVKMKV